jgi:hypothetical protein
VQTNTEQSSRSADASPDDSEITDTDLAPATSADSSATWTYADSDTDSESYSGSEFDEDAAREDAAEEVADEGYRGVGMPYGCTDDCSGHEAGFAYQATHGYGSGYSGDSLSFQQGRQAFDEAVDERVDDMRTEWETEHDDDE